MQRLSAFKADSVTFGLLEKRNTSPRNVVRLKVDGPILLQTGRVVIDKDLDSGSTELTVRLEAQQAEALRKLEEKSLEYVAGMQVDWFENVDERNRFVPGLHGQVLKLKLLADTVVFDTKRDDVSPEHYSEVANRGRHATVVFEVPYIGFARTKFGLVYSARQVLLLDEVKPVQHDDGIDADDALFDT